MNSLRVLHIGKYFPPHYGGIETFMSQLMAEQTKSGLDVSAIVHQQASSFSQFEQQWQGCRVFNVKSYGQMIYAPIAPGFLGGLIKAIKQTEPDIIHIHMPNLSAFWLLLINPFLHKKTKLIVHWHSDVIGAKPDWKVRVLYPVYRLFEYQLLRKAKAIICTSPNYLATSKPLRVFKSKCHVIPLGIDISEEVALVKNNPNEEDILKLICIGRLTYYKGHQYLFAAVKALLEQGYDIRLDVVGSGELHDELTHYIQVNNLERHIFLHGKVNPETKSTLLKNVDLLCLPSIERTEAFGMVLLEAALEAKPALVSDVPGSGMSFVVEKNKTGLVVEACSVDALVKKLEWAIENRIALSEYGQSARKTLETSFCLSVINKKVKKLYGMLS